LKIDVNEAPKTESEWTEKTPTLYFDELTWKRFLPPLPVHYGWYIYQGTQTPLTLPFLWVFLCRMGGDFDICYECFLF